MTAQEYIISTLKSLAEPVQLENIGSKPLEDAIFAKIMSKKFRKLKADDATIKIVKKAINLSVKNVKPIKFNVIFGGNKLWRFDEAPEIDWAELFAAIYLMQWMKSVASVYAPGAYFEFYSEDVVLEGMNNIPREETNQYSETFISMLDWIRNYLPPNVRVGYKRYGEQYESEEAYQADLEVAKAKVLKEIGGKLPVLNDQKKAATEMNVKLTDEQAQDPQWREKAELIHMSIERTKVLEDYINDPSWVPECPTYFPGCITTGSTKKSYAKFWVAVGALEKSGDKYSELVLTPKQLEAAEFDWENVHIEGLQGKNFTKIRVLKPISS